MTSSTCSTLEKSLPRLQKEARLVKGKGDQVAAVEEAKAVLDSGTTVFAAGLDPEPFRELFLLTAKPFLYVFNMDESELVNGSLKDEMRALVAPAELSDPCHGQSKGKRSEDDGQAERQQVQDQHRPG